MVLWYYGTMILLYCCTAVLWYYDTAVLLKYKNNADTLVHFNYIYVYSRCNVLKNEMQMFLFLGVDAV
jgi:hypothetical protein